VLQEQDEPGILHIAFAVSDIDKEYEKSRALGYEFNAPPMVARENGPKSAISRARRRGDQLFEENATKQ